MTLGTPRISYCPNDIITSAEPGVTTMNVTWIEPTVIGFPATPMTSQSHDPGQPFPIGATNVQYNFTNTADNSFLSCTFTVSVNVVHAIYLGCFQDCREPVGGSRVLPDVRHDNNQMTIKLCTDFCISQTPTMRYAGVEFSKECFCGVEGRDSRFNRLGRIEDAECDMTCRGNPDELQVYLQRTATSVQYNFTNTVDDSLLSCTFTIYVNDTTVPSISGCPDDIKVKTELGSSGISVSWKEPTAFDHNTVVRSRSHAPGTQFPIGSTTVAYIFTDSFGNPALCHFIVTVEVEDTVSPNVTACPKDVETTTELGTTGVSVTWNEPTATDLSGSPFRIRSHTPGTEFHSGVTSVNYLFMDTSNNTANCTFSIIVDTVDSTPPTISQCPDSFVSVGGRHVTWNEPIAFDLSGEINQSRSHPPGMFLMTTTNVAYMFTDSSNNSANCRFTIDVVEDIEPPSIEGCPSDIYVVHELGDSSPSVSWTKPSVLDNYERVVFIDSTHTPGQTFLDGSTQVIYTFADDSYNMAFCKFSVHVEMVDTTPPVVKSCPSDIVAKVELGTPSIAIQWSTPTATDLSGNVTLVSQSHQPGYRFSAGSRNVIYKFADNSANEISCAFVVTVQEVDATPPVVQDCPANIIRNMELGTSSIPIYWSTPTVTDSSGNVTLVSQSHRPGYQFSSGSRNVVYTYADYSENEVSCAFFVTVYEVDTHPPVIVGCPANITTTLETDSTSMELKWIEPTATDASNNVTKLYQTHVPGHEFYIGSTNVMYFYVDSSNNMAICSFSVIVIESTVKRQSGIVSSQRLYEASGDRCLVIATAALVLGVLAILVALCVLLVIFMYIRKSKPKEDIQLKSLTKNEEGSSRM
ncbi:hyalin-like [Amphiura filiformis]|uniref:hyalin-like n=1 Tax=Amphiura filiformis TaxID=82378 RepID=UPI003B20CD07